ncbi:ferredoxin [Nonomuraea endophytica]|uniref:Ferredoxin n=1 Tax=Nonomuraea endophytica TaxID=714136 RepID=A0A7W8EHD4_9ACTN|nr:ferredoxin [Nonomuraea endophytica]MBB5079464.1 ferredoxin [Nonomuraea endophytica]
MRVNVDGTKCAAYALCAEIAPQVFDLDDFGYAVATPEDVPAALEVVTGEAIEACPVQAIRRLT